MNFQYPPSHPAPKSSYLQAPSFSIEPPREIKRSQSPQIYAQTAPKINFKVQQQPYQSKAPTLPSNYQSQSHKNFHPINFNHPQ